MDRDTITHGETYNLPVTVVDTEGLPMTLAEGWSAACRICEGCVGGTLAMDVPITITDGIISGQFDSSDLSVQNYFIDVRITDDAGNDYWSEPWVLIIRPRNTPNT